MAQVYTGPEIGPEIIAKLSAGKKELWHAVHDDGSANRIRGDTVAKAASYHVIFGFFAAALMGIRKKFRNRGKTREDFAAEKEAARINRTCGALEEMLLEYFRAAQEGTVGEEILDELTDTLEEMHGYYRNGKLTVTGSPELAEMRKSISDYTAVLAKSRGVAVPENRTQGADDFSLIREQLMMQKELIRQPG